jgi:tRNA G37 N-methylase Trm5
LQKRSIRFILRRELSIAAVPFYARIDERYRTRDLTVIWGDESLETTYREHGCIFKADLKHVFVSPRLSYERMRVAKKVAPGETIVTMFAGAGCFSILIAKLQPQTKKIYSIDVNPHAYEYMKENVALNKVAGQVVPLLGDAREEAEKLDGVADRVLMPLPEQTQAFLPSAIRALHLDEEGADKGRASVRHYYTVSTGRKEEALFTIPLEKAEDIIASAFGSSVPYHSVRGEEDCAFGSTANVSCGFGFARRSSRDDPDCSFKSICRPRTVNANYMLNKVLSTLV